MRLLVLLPLALAMPSKPEEQVVNEMLDLVDSSMDQTKDRNARDYLFVSLTLSMTSSTMETTTSTRTITNSCVSGTFTECTTASRALGLSVEEARTAYPSAIVTDTRGARVDISTILPSRVAPAGRADMDSLTENSFLDIDGLLGETMQSGSMSWKEVKMSEPLQPCGRANNNRRPRFVAIEQETMTTTMTTTETATATAANTVVFEVRNLGCTSAGFEFAHPICT